MIDRHCSNCDHDYSLHIDGMMMCKSRNCKCEGFEHEV